MEKINDLKVYKTEQCVQTQHHYIYTLFISNMAKVQQSEILVGQNFVTLVRMDPESSKEKNL